VEIKGKKITQNKPIRVKSIMVRNQGKTVFSDRKQGFFVVDDTNHRWIIEIRDGQEYGRWNMDCVEYVEWL